MMNKYTISYIPKSQKNPYREYWVIKDAQNRIIWIEFTKGECERVIKDGTLQRAIDTCLVVCSKGDDYL